MFPPDSPDRCYRARCLCLWRRLLLLGFAACVGGFLMPGSALSHSALLQAESAQAVRLHATYDTGQPIAHAQVFIYAPGDPSVPWGQAVTDREGRLEFVLGPEMGQWRFQIRQAGHGAVAYVTLGADQTVIETTAAGQNMGQRAVMVALVAWGALGTALFALGRRRGRNASA